MDTVIGAIIGALAVLASNWLQHRHEAARVKQAAAERGAEAGRRRAQDAALTCDRLFTELSRSLPELHRAMRRSSYSEEDERTLGARIRAAEDAIEHAMVDLPGSIQTRVDESLQMLRQVDQLSSDSPYKACHYHGVGAISRNVAGDIHKVLTAFLRNEPPPEPTEWLIEYKAAYAELVDELEWEFAPEISESEEERKSWLDGHPAVREELSKRGFTPPD